MDKTIIRIKKFAKRNQFAMTFSVVCTLAGVVYVQHLGIKSLNEFLVEKGLDLEYYSFDIQA